MLDRLLDRGSRLTAERAAGGRQNATAEMAIAFLVTLIVIAAFRARPVPQGNEWVYLLTPWHFAHPDFLASDWTFGKGFSDHFVFDAFVSLPMRVFSIEAVAWIGRVAGWSLLVWWMLRLCSRLGLRPLVGGLAIALFVVNGEALYGSEWLFVGFESKVFAYLLLFAGLERTLAGRENQGALLLGLAFVLHAVVGASVMFAAAVGFIAVERNRQELLNRGLFLAIGGVIGALAIAPVLVGNVSAPDVSRLMTLVVLPLHLDVSSWKDPPIALSFGLLAFNVLQYLAGPRERGVKFFVAFQCALGALTAIGLVAHAARAYALLAYYPFRVFPLLIPFFFVIHLIRAFRMGQLTPASPVVGVAALVLVLKMGERFPSIRWQLETMRTAWKIQPDGVAQAFDWIRKNTSPASVIVVPPWRKDSFYYTHRPQVVNFHAVASDRFPEWRERNESLIGPLDSLPGGRPADMKRHYDNLSLADILAVRSKYGGDYLVSTSTYDLPVVFRKKGQDVVTRDSIPQIVSVYDLRAVPR